MSERKLVETTNLDRYGNDALSWGGAYEQLTAEGPDRETYFILSTTRPDGRPHATRVGALCYDGDLYFTSNPTTRKSRNLAENPAATFTAILKGIDLVLEGKATRTTDPNQLDAVASRYRDGGWPAQVEGDAITAPYSAPSAGPPPWHLYRFIFDTVIGVATEEPYGATRWRFTD
jgi:hypothetical protein